MAFEKRFKAFLSGYASAFNYMGNRRSSFGSSNGFERDAQALAGDWRRVGNDLRNAMSMVGAYGK